MIRVAEKIRLHTVDEVRESVVETLEALAGLDLTEAERVALLPQVFSNVAARHVQLEQVELTGALAAPHMTIPRG